MRHILSFHYSTLKHFCQALAALALVLTSVIAPVISGSSSASAVSSATAVSANNFYFEDATYDYYLEKTESGSKMHVKEVLTAVFPSSDQNHGITRRIPFTNLNGTNTTVENFEALNLSVLRNGAPESVAKYEQDSDEYIIYIGSTGSYVHGTQVYTLEYDFYNVISEFTSLGQNVTGEKSENVAYQELYWDTNGTGWSQAFDSLTARLHLPAEIAKNLTTGTSCYVGRYGQSGQSRCEITSDDETTYSPTSLTSVLSTSTAPTTAETILTFETESLLSGENLTFVVNFLPGTFVVPELQKNYTLVILLVVVTSICGLILFFAARHYLKNGAKKRKYYKNLFVAPQYQPEKTYHVAEAAELSLSRTENSYVATLLELATSGKISIIKGEPTKFLNKNTWEIKLNNINDLTESQIDLLKILNGGSSIKNVETIKIKKHTATSSLASLSRLYYSDAKSSLKTLKLFEEKTSTQKSANIATIAATIVGIFGFYILINSITTLIDGFVGLMSHGVVVGSEIIPFVIGIEIFATIITLIFISSLNGKYSKYTEKGLESANYLEGLKLYIKMAEADRLKFLQSVKGADTSEKGIVKLYEKLLPYAALFGLEDSWMDEFNKYCQDINYSPTWYSGDEFLNGYMLASMTSNVRSTISSSTSYSSSSGGSSFSSGGGGGGFSGGGGGGGGGGGW